MLMWPVVAALGFLALTGLVIALGTSSTARYDFERNRVQGPEAATLDRSAGAASGKARSAKGPATTREVATSPPG